MKITFFDINTRFLYKPQEDFFTFAIRVENTIISLLNRVTGGFDFIGNMVNSNMELKFPLSLTNLHSLLNSRVRIDIPRVSGFLHQG